jgi:hypothetical protein
VHLSLIVAVVILLSKKDASLFQIDTFKLRVKALYRFEKITDAISLKMMKAVILNKISTEF